MDTLMQKFTLKLFILAFFLTIPKSLLSIESLAKTALIMDLSTGEVLLEKNQLTLYWVLRHYYKIIIFLEFFLMYT